MASTAVAAASGNKLMKYRFILAIFAGSFLLFMVQPMIARMALPRVGGAPAVWNSAMLVYQLLLLGGYAYAHWLGRFAPRMQAGIHLAVLLAAAIMLPIGLAGGHPSAEANIILWVPWLLLVSIGPLFFAIAAQAPLLQRWFALTDGGDPYPLYAASNLGSFAGLIAYPLLIEPMFPLAIQSGAWSIGYAAVVILVAACGLVLPRSAETTQRSSDRSSPPFRETAIWMLLAAVPSGLILSTTLYLTTDIVAMPLLWVVPLGLYLLSFTIAFASDRRPAKWISVAAPFALLIAAGCLFLQAQLWLVAMSASVLCLFTVAVALHSALFDRRPDPQQLTAFYLYLAIGGAIGGIIGALIAPMLFDWTYEHLLLMAAAAFLLPVKSPFGRFVTLWDGDRTAQLITRWGIPMILLASLAGQAIFGMPERQQLVMVVATATLAIGIFAIGNRYLFAAAVTALMMGLGGWGKLALSMDPGQMSRSFFGVYTIKNEPDVGARMLLHGTTIHGLQMRGSPELERTPTTYFAPPSGAGLALTAAPTLFGGQARVGIVGLGAGTLACYARPGQHWTFYEIDPTVVEIASDPNRFSFLARCNPDVPVVIGDARLTLERAAPKSLDVLVIDAFSSDSIPMHLLTLEAFGTYRRVLSNDGLLLVHISNRHLDLTPVIAAAASAGWTARQRHYSPTRKDIDGLNHLPSLWMALSPSPEKIASLEKSNPDAWKPLEPRPGFTPWTDDYSSVLPVLRRLH